MLVFTENELKTIQTKLSTPNSDLLRGFKCSSESEVADFFGKEAYTLLTLGRVNTLQYRFAIEDLKNAKEISKGNYTLRTRRQTEVLKESSKFQEISHLKPDEFDAVCDQIPRQFRVVRNKK